MKIRIYWHDCHCPDIDPYKPELGRNDVTYCPTHGIAARIVAELGTPVNCGCDDCGTSQNAVAGRHGTAYETRTPGIYFDLPSDASVLDSLSAVLAVDVTP